MIKAGDIKIDHNLLTSGSIKIRREDEDVVNQPKHYTYGNIEVIDVIEDWNLGFHLGNAVKYIARCEHKDNKVQDLEKSLWYIQRELDREVDLNAK